MALTCRLPVSVGATVFGSLQCERTCSGATILLNHTTPDEAACEVHLQGNAKDCYLALLQVLQHAAAAHSSDTYKEATRDTAVWQIQDQGQQHHLMSSADLGRLPLQGVPESQLCLHVPSSCLIPLHHAASFCQDLDQGPAAAEAARQEPSAGLTTPPAAVPAEGADEDGDVVMAEEEAEQLVSSLQDARNDSNEWLALPHHPSIAMLLFGQQGTEEQQQPMPMDFAVTEPGTVRLYVVLDTSVLLTHWSFLQALHRHLAEGGMVPAEAGGGEQGSGPAAPGVQLVLVVPWAVLVELDKLKEQRPVLRIKGEKRDIAPVARRAIGGLASLMTQKRCLQYQSEADANRANLEHGASDKKVLNDDSIVHCSMDVQKRLHEAHLQGDMEAGKSGAVLLSKDNNMLLKAQANGVKALGPAHFPAAQPHLHRHLLAVAATTSLVKPGPPAPPQRPAHSSGVPPPEAFAPASEPASNGPAPDALAVSQAASQKGHQADAKPTAVMPSKQQLLGLPQQRMQLQRQRQQESQQQQQQQQQQQNQQLPHLQGPQHQQQDQQPQRLQALALQQQQLQLLQLQQHLQQHLHLQQQQQQQAQEGQGQQHQLYQHQQQGQGQGHGQGQGQGALLQPWRANSPFAEALDSMHMRPHGAAPTGAHDQAEALAHLRAAPLQPVQLPSRSGALEQPRGIGGYGSSASSSSGMQRRGSESGNAAEHAQELASQVWSCLQDGLQPFMQWDLQQGLGELWTQAISRAPPWEVEEMLQVMKKDMSGVVHKSGELSRCHQRLTMAAKHRARSPSLAAVADLASQVSSLLLLLHLPNKTDTVAHVEEGAVTGKEARQALQEAREQARQLAMQAQAASEGQSASKGNLAGSAVVTSRALPSNQAGKAPGAVRHSPGVTGQSPRPIGQSPALALQGLRLVGPSPRPGAQGLSHMTRAVSDYMPAQMSSSMLQPGYTSTAAGTIPSGQLDLQLPLSPTAAGGIGPGMSQQDGHSDPLQSAQGLLGTFGASAKDHLSKVRQNLQQQPHSMQLREEATRACSNVQGIAQMLLQTAAAMQTSTSVQQQAGTMRQCVLQIHIGLASMFGLPQALLPVTPALLTDLHHLLCDKHKVQGAVSLAYQLQHDALLTASYIPQ